MVMFLILYTSVSEFSSIQAHSFQWLSFFFNKSNGAGRNFMAAVKKKFDPPKS